MAAVTLDQLPPALYLSGAELVWLYQVGPTEATPWIGVNCTVGDLAAYIVSGGFSSQPTMRQLLAAMAGENVLVSAAEALPSDITNEYNIAWNHAFRMSLSDPFITGFLEPTLGYSQDQMQALFTLALTYPA